MDVMTAIKGRRSVRNFTDEPIDKDTLLKLLEAAVWAPSGGNGQTWRFVVITEPAMLKKIKMFSLGLLGDPPAVIVIAQDMALARHKGGKMDKKNFENQIFELVSYMATSACNLLEEPARYGPFRLVDAASRLIDILEESGNSSERLNSIRKQIESGKYSAMGTDEQFKEFLEVTVFTVVDAIDITEKS